MQREGQVEFYLVAISVNRRMCGQTIRLQTGHFVGSHNLADPDPERSRQPFLRDCSYVDNF
jgi:hypothetical protein